TNLPCHGNNFTVTQRYGRNTESNSPHYLRYTNPPLILYHIVPNEVDDRRFGNRYRTLLSTVHDAKKTTHLDSSHHVCICDVNCIFVYFRIRSVIWSCED